MNNNDVVRLPAACQVSGQELEIHGIGVSRGLSACIPVGVGILVGTKSL